MAFDRLFTLASTLILASSLFYVCHCEDDSDKLWILISNANLRTCSGAPNQFALSQEDVSVKDKSSNVADWFEAPGSYNFEFKNIKVLKQVTNINGRMAATLQVPLVKVGPISMDFPYQVIPQKTLMEGSSCDNESGVVYDSTDKREYCRYCDLCPTAAHVENQLSSNALGKVYTPNLGTGKEETFSKVCQKMDSKTYSLTRSAFFPGKKELKSQIDNRYKGTVEGVASQKLTMGIGKIQVFLFADSNSEAPVDSNQWYANNKSCTCCVKDQLGSSKCRASFMESVMGKKSSTCLKCNNEYVKSCLKGKSERIVCFVVEYNFKLTDNRTEFEAFKKKLAASKQGQGAQPSVIADQGPSGVQAQGGASANASVQPSSGSVQAQGQGSANVQQSQSQGTASNPSPSPCSECDRQACIVKMNSSGKQFCQDMPNKTGFLLRYCCNQCPTVCSSK